MDYGPKYGAHGRIMDEDVLLDKIRLLLVGLGWKYEDYNIVRVFSKGPQKLTFVWVCFVKLKF